VSRHRVPSGEDEPCAAKPKKALLLDDWLDRAIHAEHDPRGTAEAVCREAPANMRAELARLVALAEVIETLRSSGAPSPAFRWRARTRLMTRIAAAPLTAFDSTSAFERPTNAPVERVSQCKDTVATIGAGSPSIGPVATQALGAVVPGARGPALA
jgi:hypothetical protein